MLAGLTRKVKDWLQRPAPQPAPAASPPSHETTPDAARRLYQAGVELLRAGQASDALISFTEAIALAPEFAEAHNEAGLALRQLGRFEDAAEHFQRAVDARHDYLPAINNRGMTFLEMRRYEEAEDSFKLALAFNPGAADAWFNLGALRWEQGMREEAIAGFRRAADLDPDSVRIQLTLAGLLYTSERFDEALACYRRADDLGPDLPEFHLNMGLTLMKLNQFEEAVQRFERALASRPDFPEAYFNLGNARGGDQPGQAIECYRRAIELKPDYAEAWSNLGNTLKLQGAIDQALEAYRTAASIKPDYAEAHHNMGVAFNYLGRAPEAIACYEKAREVAPDRPESQLNLAITRLLVGDFARGWAGYEWRFRQTSPDNRILSRDFPYPRWEGQPLAGRRILVWGEQGIGDEILFSGIYREVLEAAKRCVIECTPKLLPLFSRSFPGATVVARSDPAHPATREPFDYQSPAGGLARWLRPTAASFPARPGHLAASPERVAFWKERLAPLGEGLRVGFSWRSVNAKGERAHHFADLSQWEPVLRTRGVHFVSLQYDECSSELARAQERLGVKLHAFPEVDLFNDLDEAAALTQALDLVISAPTSVSVLAAALGVPTWQTTYGADWQVHGADRNLWYPAMTQFRRAWDQSWEEILQAMAARLEQHVAQAPRRTVPQAGPVASPVDKASIGGVAAQDEGTADGSAAAARRYCVEGLQLARAGLHEDAAACLQRAVDLKHDYVDALVGLGHVHIELEQHTDAADCFHLALAFDARCAAAHAGLGDLSWRLGSATEAVEHLRQAVSIDPRLPGPLVVLGAISYAAGKEEEALTYHEAASALEPENAELHYNVGIALQNLNRTEEALARFHRAIALKPDLLDAHFNVGNASLKKGEIPGAIASYQRVIALKPDHAKAHNNIANAYGAAGDLERALDSVRRSLALNPDSPEATCNMGIILHHQGRLREAIACYEQARSMVPDSAEAELNLGIACMMNGDFAGGWAGYEWRFRANNSENRLLKHQRPCRTWQGEDLAGKTILVWGEQGIGDQLLFASLFEEISRDARSCLIECAHKLVPLFSRSFPAASLVPMTNPPHPDTKKGFDYQISLGSIARWRRPDLASFPRRNGYLAPDPGRVAYWQSRLAALGHGPKVGFCWRSNNTTGERALSCTDLSQWGPIFAVPGAHFVSLQYDECFAERAEAERRFGLTLHVFPEVDLFNDLDEAAALARACDLVVTAPTAVSILAAAVGVETWQMSYGPDWQTHGTRLNPWLPTMVRFERAWNQSWDEMIPNIARALAEWLQQRTPGI